MALLHDLRGIFIRRRPVVVNLSASHNGDRSSGSHISVEPKLRRAHESAAAGESDRGSAATARALTQTGQTLEEAMSLVRNISTHLDTQTQQTDRLIECLSRLPEALEALPQMNRQNARLFEIVSEYLGSARRREDALNSTLDGIGESTRRHTEVLGLLQQQLDAAGRRTEVLTDQLGDFHDALAALAGSNARTTAVLSELAQTNETREVELTHLLARTQRWLLGAMICCAAMSAAAIAVAALALLS
jgi:hypothetical protein